MDPVTTTDELIPSGETSFRSNPLGLAEFTRDRFSSAIRRLPRWKI
jgi:aconitate hydratase